MQPLAPSRGRPRLELVLGALNGLVGDHLVRTKNVLATDLTFVHDGEPLPIDRESVARALPQATAKVAILVHGLTGRVELRDSARRDVDDHMLRNAAGDKNAEHEEVKEP